MVACMTFETDVQDQLVGDSDTQLTGVATGNIGDTCIRHQDAVLHYLPIVHIEHKDFTTNRRLLTE